MPRKKERLNVTIDPDIARSARHVFKALDMNMSGFVEYSLATFLQGMKSFEPLLDQIERGEVDPAALKSAMRAFQSNANGMIGAYLVDFGKVSQDLQEFIDQDDTDKK